MRLRVYIGHDSRENAAYQVCAASLVRRTSIDLEVRRLDLPALRDAGLYWRKMRREGHLMIDEADGRPFSTEFAFSRFLVPALCRRDGYAGWALFMDSDMLITRDVAGLLSLLDPEKALMCVQHRQEVSSGTKMDGQSQVAYPRKNWSSFMCFNLADPAHNALTADVVNSETGRWLHGLSWLADEQIGALPETWNWLEGYSSLPENGDLPANIHYTRGGPWFEQWQDVGFAELWRLEHRRLLNDGSIAGAVARLLAA